MKAFRIVRPDFKSPADAFSGRGGLYAEGRWNHLGQLVVYTSGSLSLAELETIVHLKSPRSLTGYVWFSIEIPDELIESTANLPDGWNLPFYAPSARVTNESPSVNFGSHWLMEKRSVGLKVPSAILPEESNLIVNPAHERFDLSMVKGPFPLVWDNWLA